MRERRRFPRFDCSYRVRYASQGLASLESDTQALDISKVGIRIVVSRIIKKGDLLKMDIDPPDKSDMVSVVGTVRWTRTRPARPALLADAGVEFVEAEPYSIERLIPASEPLPAS